MGGKRQRINKRRRSKLSQQDIAEKAEALLNLKTANDLCSLLSIPDTAFIDLITGKFEEFTIPKRSGGRRVIVKPTGSVLAVQESLNSYLQSVYFQLLPPYVFGNILHLEGTPNRDALQNATLHHGREYIMNLDVKDFYSSIDKSKVREVFLNTPFFFKEELADFLCRLVTYNGHLPTGAATSSIISNFVFLELDHLLYELAIKYSAEYSRYIDDFTFSFNAKPSNDFLKKVVLLLESQGFKISWDKFQIRGKNQRQVVTGIIVNEYPNVRSKYYKELRAVIHNLSIKNFEEEVQKYVTANLNGYRRSIRNYWIRRFKNKDVDVEITSDACVGLYENFYSKVWYIHKSIRGKLSYIGHILGLSHPKYIKLYQQYHGSIAFRSQHDKFIKLELSPDLVYITNATSKSVVYYAYSFLNNAGYNNEKVNKLREELQLKDLSDWKKQQEKLQDCFINKSIYFLDLYHYMQEVKELESVSDDQFVVKDWGKLIQNLQEGLYKRRIFHSDPNCSYLHSDYEEDKYFKNTGVFAEEKPVNEPKLYLVDRAYLVELGMRSCKMCGEKGLEKGVEDLELIEPSRGW